MTSIAEYRRALADVPSVVLSPDDRRVLEDVRVTLDVLENTDIVPASVAFVGPSGAGKSMLVNACVGAQVAESGVRRPTTGVVTMYGNSGPRSLAAESEYVHVPSAPPGLVVIDTPPWEHDEAAVASTMQAADLTVMVVTPTRYGDAAMAELQEQLPARRPAAVVLNRVAPDRELDRPVLLAAVRDRFGASVIAVEEGGDLGEAIGTLLTSLDIDADAYQRGAVLRSAAAGAGRYLAGAVTAAAPEVARLDRAISGVDPAASRSDHTVFEEWPATRAEIVADVERARRRVDEQVSSDGGSLADRIRSTLPDWDPGTLAVELDAWRAATIAAFTGSARIRWRRAAAESLIERFAWRMAINPGVEVPQRLRRIVGDRLPAVREGAGAELERAVVAPVAARVAAWRDVARELGAYTPGELLTVAESFGGTSP